MQRKVAKVQLLSSFYTLILCLYGNFKLMVIG